MKRKLALVLAMVMVLMLALTGCSNGAPDTGTPDANKPDNSNTNTTTPDTKPTEDGDKEPTANIAIIFSTLGDLNFNDWCWDGINQAKDELGIDFKYVEAGTVSEAATQIDAFASDELYDLIIVVGSDRGDAMEEAAAAYPDQKFALIDAGVKTDLPNVIGVRADYPQWQFLSGCLAGLVTTRPDEFGLANADNKVGFVGGADTPTSRAGAAGFLAGVKYTNHDAELEYSIVGKLHRSHHSEGNCSDHVRRRR